MVIENNGTGNASAIYIDTASSGTGAITLSNDGTIKQTSANATGTAGITVGPGTKAFILENRSTGVVHSEAENAIDVQPIDPNSNPIIPHPGNVTIENDGKITIGTTAKNGGYFAIDGSSGSGKMTITNTGTIGGGIRLSSGANNVINFEGGNITGNGKYAIDGDKGSSDTLNFDGAGTKTIAGGVIRKIEKININGGVAQIWSDITDTDSLTVNSGAKLIIDNNTTDISGDVDVQGNMTLINPEITKIGGDFKIGSKGEIKINLSGNIPTKGILEVSKKVIINKGAKVKISHGVLTKGQKIKILMPRAELR